MELEKDTMETGLILKGWQSTKLKDLVLKANTGLDAIKRAPIVSYETDHRCLRIQDVSQKKDFENWGYCEVTNENYEKFCLKDGDIIIARTGETIGVNILIKDNLKAVFNNGLIRLKVDHKKTTPLFLYFNFQSNRYREYINSISRGTSTQPNMQIGSLLDFEILLPSLEIQKQITDILSSLSDKIFLNNQINSNLEIFSSVLFKQWFIDFNFPDRKGKPYKTENGKMTLSEFGMIPEGWTVEPAQGFFDFTKGIEPGNKNYLDLGYENTIPFFRVGDIFNGNQSKVFIKKPDTDTAIMNPSDVLFSTDGTVGRVAIGLYGSYSGGIKKVTSKNKSITNSFIYLWLKSNLVQDKLREYASNATTIAHASGAIKDLRIIYNKETIEKFCLLNEPIFETIVNNLIENIALKKIIDSLSPRLMSGGIKIPINR